MTPFSRICLPGLTHAMEKAQIPPAQPGAPLLSQATSLLGLRNVWGVGCSSWRVRAMQGEMRTPSWGGLMGIPKERRDFVSSPPPPHISLGSSLIFPKRKSLWWYLAYEKSLPAAPKIPSWSKKSKKSRGVDKRERKLRGRKQKACVHWISSLIQRGRRPQLNPTRLACGMCHAGEPLSQSYGQWQEGCVCARDRFVLHPGSLLNNIRPHLCLALTAHLFHHLIFHLFIHSLTQNEGQLQAW